MLDFETKEWDYTMDGNEFEAMIGIARGCASCMYSRICKLFRSGGPDLRKDEDFLALDKLSDRIFEEKDKTMEYWMAEVERLSDKVEAKLRLKTQ